MCGDWHTWYHSFFMNNIVVIFLEQFIPKKLDVLYDPYKLNLSLPGQLRAVADPMAWPWQASFNFNSPLFEFKPVFLLKPASIPLPALKTFLIPPHHGGTIMSPGLSAPRLRVQDPLHSPYLLYLFNGPGLRPL